MTPETRRKAYVYCIENRRLLVFRHVDFSPEEVGIQVPGGSVRPDETPAEAALRELMEETGRSEFAPGRHLGDATYDIRPYRAEVQERAFFLARQVTRLPDRWSAMEEHDGAAPPTRLEFFWIPLACAHILQAGQGALIGRITAADLAGAAT